MTTTQTHTQKRKRDGRETTDDDEQQLGENADRSETKGTNNQPSLTSTVVNGAVTDTLS